MPAKIIKNTKMQQIPDNVRPNLIKLVPSSVVVETTCYKFFDKHPLDERNLDIIVCTSSGELKEFFQREIVSSVFIKSKATNIYIVRNNKCELFYIVSSNDELIVLSRKNSPEVLLRLSTIERFEIEDSACSGLSCFKIYRKDDAVPLIFDENFENISEQTPTSTDKASDDSLPLVKQLMRKFTEAKYTVQSNEKAYKDLLRLRQQASFAACETDKLLVLRCTKPQVMCCNGKIVLMLDAVRCKIPVQDFSILLHGTTRPSLSYTTKVYEKLPQTPHWKETTQDLDPESSYDIACVIEVKEVQYNITSRIDLEAVICYKIDNKENFLSLQSISLSALDIMDKDLNLLPKMPKESDQMIKATMATTENMKLCLRHIINDCDLVSNVLDLFCEYLQMERLDSNTVVHRLSPFHTLHGVMIVLEKSDMEPGVCIMTVYTRCTSQVLALINYIHDAIPYKIIITTTNQIITTKHDTCPEHSKEIKIGESIDNTEYGSSILNQTSSVLNYLDNCMIKMNESKNPSILNKVGIEIDTFAGGLENFKEFRRKFLEEGAKGIDSLKKCKGRADQEDQGMVIDSD